MYALIGLVVASASIAVGLAITPSQQVSAAGQTFEVGGAGPSLHWSGPGELDLFGQQLDTSLRFSGPIRPRIQLTHITLSKQLENFVQASSGTSATTSLAKALSRGFRHYVYWQVGIVGLAAVLFAGAVSGWMRQGWRHSLALIGSLLVLTEALNLGAIMVTAYSAPAELDRVQSLQSLVGNAPELRVPVKAPASQAGRSIVVLGDSTAAGLGLRPLPHPTEADHACNRSINAYAVALSNASGTPVTNLACSDATIHAGLLGPQTAGSIKVPPQLSRPAVAAATTVLVSVGANDVKWADLLRICAVSASCQNNAEQAAFQQYLAKFSTDYLQLLSQLQALPQHPRVVINLYYDPLGDEVDCLSHLGLTSEKQKAMRSTLDALNQVLSSGAQAASFITVQPNFADHGLCSQTPFVQGIHSTAPFHPTAAGELAIALADEHALQITN